MNNFEQFLFESVTFKEGDHVHMHFAGPTGLVTRGSHNPSDYSHGVVSSHSSTMAKVKWENGKESTHKQSDGMERGSKGYDPHAAISHNVSHIPGSKRMTNAEHKRHLIKIHDEDNR